MKRLLFALALLASCKHSPRTTTTVGAAISLKEAAEELQPPGEVQWAFGASGSCGVWASAADRAPIPRIIARNAAALRIKLIPSPSGLPIVPVWPYHAISRLMGT